MNEFFSWDILITMAGCTAATALITQFVKGAFAKLPTQILSYIIALAILAASTAAIGGFAQTWTVWAILPLNAVVVSTSANGVYAAVKRAMGKE